VQALYCVGLKIYLFSNFIYLLLFCTVWGLIFRVQAFRFWVQGRETAFVCVCVCECVCVHESVLACACARARARAYVYEKVSERERERASERARERARSSEREREPGVSGHLKQPRDVLGQQHRYNV
jgi:hypothetical protein